MRASVPEIKESSLGGSRRCAAALAKYGWSVTASVSTSAGGRGREWAVVFAALGQESKVVYKDKAATDLARRLFAHVQSIVRSFPGAERDTFVMDGNSLTVSLCFAGDKAEVRIDGIASAADADSPVEQ